MPEAALAGAAAQVLVDLHPDYQGEIAALFQSALQRLPPGPDTAAGLAVGVAVGKAAIARRTDDGYGQIHAFAGDDAPGRWRPTPPDHATSNTTAARPFVMPSRDWPAASSPSADGPAFPRDVEEVRRMGTLQGSARTAGQTYAAQY